MSTRIFFISNGMYGDNVGGGDLHGYQMAEAAQAAGYELHFIGGHALKGYLQKRGFGGEIEVSGAESGFNDGRQSGFFNVNLAAAKRIENGGVDIHTQDLVAVGREHRGRRQADVPESQNADGA